MTYEQRERVGALTGVGAALFFVGGMFLTDIYPGPSATASEVQRFVIDNRTGLLWQTAVFGFGIALALWFLGSLRSSLRRAEGGAGRVAGIAYGAGLIASSFLMLQLTLLAGLANRISEQNPAPITDVLFRLGVTLQSFMAVPIIVMLGATALVSLRTGLLPKWLTVSTAVPIAASLVGMSAIFSRTGAFAPGGEVAFYAPFASLMVWSATTSIVLATKVVAPSTNVARRRIGDIDGRVGDAITERRRRTADY